jgi:hypothetical protein
MDLVNGSQQSRRHCSREPVITAQGLLIGSEYPLVEPDFTFTELWRTILQLGFIVMKLAFAKRIYPSDI